MNALEGGWWQAEVSCEIAYRFVLDGGTPFPDPRFPWQPLGIHGPSRSFSDDEFTWGGRTVDSVEQRSIL